MRFPASPAKCTVRVPQATPQMQPPLQRPTSQVPGVNCPLAKVRDHHDGHHGGGWCHGAMRTLMLIPLWKAAAGCPPLTFAGPFSLTAPLLWGKVLTVGWWESPDQPHTFAQGKKWGGRVWPFPTWDQRTSGCGGCFPAAPCLQPMDEGSCRHYALLWYYHLEANACRPFIFGGCRGNGNRFETKWKCERRCKTSAGKAAPEPSNPPLPPTRSEVKAGKNPSTIHPPPYGAPPGPSKDLEGCLWFARSFPLSAHFGCLQYLLGAPGHFLPWPHLLMGCRCTCG